MSMKQAGIGGAPALRQRRAYVLGGSPTSSRNVALNEPRLRKPTSTLISVTDSEVPRSSSLARSIRRRWRYRCGVSPNARLKLRLKCAVDAWAARARSATSNGCAYSRSIRSFARSRCG
jgi:hypothetical protein